MADGTVVPEDAIDNIAFMDLPAGDPEQPSTSTNIKTDAKVIIEHLESLAADNQIMKDNLSHIHHRLPDRNDHQGHQRNEVAPPHQEEVDSSLF